MFPYQRLTQITLCLVFLCFIPAALGGSGDFTNGNFETGDFTGWTQGGGYWYGEWPIDPTDYAPGGNKYNISYNASTVVSSPQEGDPRTDGNLMPIYNGHNTAKVNDEYNNNSISVISQTVANYNNPHIYFAWAAVLQSSHGPTDSDNFTLKLTDDTTHETVYSVAYNSADASTAGLFTRSISDWYYTSWQVQDLDVSSRIGHTFTLLLLASDCPYGGHAGYVYLDGFGAVTPPTGENTGGPVTVTSTDLGTVSQGSAISGSVTVSGGTPPYTYTTANNLPAGVSVQGASLSGVAGAPGSYSVTIIATDSTGSSAAGSISYKVFGLTSTTLPTGVLHSPYVQSLAVSGGMAPYTYNASNLPPGLSINSGGTIQGVPSAIGSYSIPLTITDSTGISFSTTVSINVIAPLPLQITSTALPAGMVRTVYSNNLTAAGGAPPYTWTLVSGTLPEGLVLHPGGSITGSPARAGSANFVVRVVDNTGASVAAGVTLNVAPASLTILNPSPLAAGIVSIDYPITLFRAAGGVAPYKFAVTNGSLPSGLGLASDGTLSGTPKAAGVSMFSVTVTDSTGATGTAQPTISIRPYSVDLVLSAGSVVFNAVQGSRSAPPAQNVTVQSSSTTTPISYAVSMNPPVNWLSVQTGGQTPGVLRLSLSDAAQQLAGGVTPYQTTVNVTCASATPCSGNSQPLLVALNVAIQPPALSISSDLMSFSSDPATASPSSQTLQLQNTGGGAVGIASVTCAASWCSVSGVPGFINSGNPADLQVTTNPAGLSPGFYRTTLDVRASTGSYSLPITLFVSGGAAITVQPVGVQFSSVAGGVPTAVGPSSFYVGAAGPSSISWTASVLPGADWLTLNTTSGSSTSSTPGLVNFSVNGPVAQALPAGPYYGRIHVNAPSIENGSVDFEVVLNVAPAGSPQRPNPSPSGLLFISSAATPPPPQAITIASNSSLPVAFQAAVDTTDGGSWLSINSPTGTAVPGSPAQTQVSVNPSSLKPGVYYGAVNYAFAPTAVRSVNVTLIVTNGSITAGAKLRTSLVPHADSGCQPAAMVPAQIGLVNNFSSPAAWPTPLAVQLVNDCGQPVTNGQVVATFSNGDAPIPLAIANPQTGIYSATWTPRHSAAQVTITARATAPGFSAITTNLSGVVTPNNAPVLTPHSTLHVFDPEVGAGLGPGTIVQLYGENLASGTTSAASIPLATRLNGTSVLIGGISAPLYFTSAGQINAQIPFELQPGSYQVIVSANGALTTPDTIQLTPVSPGLAALPDGTIIAQHPDGSLVTGKSPAKPGEFLVMYVAGLGITDNPVTTGDASPSSPLAIPQVLPMLTIGTQQARVLFAGLTPGLVGLYQVNFQVPSDAPNGDLTLLLSQSDLKSNSAILPVHN